MMMMNRIIEEIKKAKKIAIFPHVSADGDSIGSSLALHLALKKIGISSDVITEETISHNYSFLEGSKEAIVYTNNNNKYDIAIAIDCGDIERIGHRYEVFENAIATINIDHHPTNKEFAIYNYIDVSVSSVGEIIYQIIKLMGIDIEKSIAEALYVAISTDTGGFRYSNTTAITHQIIADLINSGVNVANISQRIFDTISLEKSKLIAAAISSIEILERGKIAFITISKDAFEKTGANECDFDGIADIGRNIEGVEVAVSFRQLDDKVTKINFRSKNYVDVATIACLYKGGGHHRAAGATVGTSLEELKEMVLKDLREAL